jgi:hypothetical protein
MKDTVGHERSDLFWPRFLEPAPVEIGFHYSGSQDWGLRKSLNDGARSLCLFACLVSSPVLFVETSTLVYFFMFLSYESVCLVGSVPPIWILNRYIPIFRDTLPLFFLTRHFSWLPSPWNGTANSRNSHCSPWFTLIYIVCWSLVEISSSKSLC